MRGISLKRQKTQLVFVGNTLRGILFVIQNFTLREEQATHFLPKAEMCSLRCGIWFWLENAHCFSLYFWVLAPKSKDIAKDVSSLSKLRGTFGAPDGF